MAPPIATTISGDTRANLPIDEEGRLYHIGLKSGEGISMIMRG
jgi:hypothetical protein